MKKFNKILSIMLAVIMLFTSIARVSAENYDNYSDEIGGTKTFEFSKYLVTNVGSVKPDVDFTFRITSGVDKEGTSNTVKQIAGPTPDKITVSHGTDTNATDVVQGAAQEKTTSLDAYREFTVKFHSTDDHTVINGEKAVNPHGGEVAAVKNIKFDFSDVAFSEPGVYRYIIQELETSTNPDVENDEEPYRTLDVYVEDNTTDPTNPKLKITGYVLYYGDLEDTAASKDSEFISGGFFDLTKDDAGRGKPIIEDTWTYTESVPSTFTYSGGEWTVDPSNLGISVTPPNDAVVSDGSIDLTYSQAVANTEVDPTQYIWVAKVSVTSVYTYDAENKFWKDNHGNEGASVVVPNEAFSSFNNNDKFGDAYKTEFDVQKENFDSSKSNEVDTYAPGNGAEAGDKTDKYVNKYLRYNIVVKKEVTGNQGSKDQFFRFTVEIDAGASHKGAVITLITPDTVDESWKEDNTKPNNATSYSKGVIYTGNTRDDDPDLLTIKDMTETDAKKYIWNHPTINEITIYWNDEDGTWQSKNSQSGTTNDLTWQQIITGTPSQNATYDGADGQQIILNDEGKATVTVYLQNDEKAKLLNLPDKAKYSVVEAESNKDGYKTTGEQTTLKTLDNIIKTFEEVKNDDNLTLSDYEFKDSEGNEYYFKNNGWKKILAGTTTEEDITQDEIPDDATTTVYTETVTVINDRNGVIPTGVFVAAGTGFAILGVGIVGMLALSRRKEEDEEE